ncbi:MAG TPA: DUF3540 domain-containing protein [Crenalkalicoccus sp.]|jgi:Ser/Thr protein kinase RdoA (MazF antagonist)|nr:DUF3540 domain-containing protein [Crenalkalicoccus sp.]
MNAISGLAATGSTALAEVLAREGEELVLRQENGLSTAARRAFSCLVQPESGDRVLVAAAGEEAFVLAVLERRGGRPMTLALPDGATLAAPAGRLAVAAETLVLEARRGQVAVQELGLSGKRLDARLGRIALVAEAIETLAERVLGRFRRSYRFVEEGEQLRARDIDQRATGHLNLQAETTTLQAGLLVKLDAAQIHMG